MKKLLLTVTLLATAQLSAEPTMTQEQRQAMLQDIQSSGEGERYEKVNAYKHQLKQMEGKEYRQAVEGLEQATQSEEALQTRTQTRTQLDGDGESLQTRTRTQTRVNEGTGEGDQLHIRTQTRMESQTQTQMMIMQQTQQQNQMQSRKNSNYTAPAANPMPRR